MREVLRVVDAVMDTEGGGRGALRGLSLEVYAGEIVYIFGNAGSGIRSLRRLFEGEELTSGRIYENGVLRGKSLRRSRKTYVSSEGDDLIGSLSVAENLEIEGERPLFGLYSAKKVRERAGRYLRESGVEVDPGLRADQLGSTQKLLISLIKARMQHAALVVLDLTVMTGTDASMPVLVEMMKLYRSQGMSFVVLSERLGAPAPACDRLIRISYGRDQMEWSFRGQTYREPGTQESGRQVLGEAEGPFEGILELDRGREEELSLRLSELRAANRDVWEREIGIPLVPAGSVSCGGTVLIPRESGLLFADNLPLGKQITLSVPGRVAGGLFRPISGEIETNVRERFFTVTGIRRDIRTAEELDLVERRILSAFRWELAKPDTMVFENPFWCMDFAEERRFVQYLLHLKESGIRVIIFSGAREEIEKYCRKVTKLSREVKISPLQ